MRTLLLDADTVLIASAAQEQENSCLAIEKGSGKELTFPNKTAFKDWMKQEGIDANDWDVHTVSEVVGEPRFAFKNIKDKIDNILSASGCNDILVFIEGEGNFRREYNSPYQNYKGQRTEKPLLYHECRDYMIRKYGSKLVQSIGIETDDLVSIYAWEEYRKAYKTKKKSDMNVVVGYADKDIPANVRGWLINYYNLKDNKVYWNNGFMQEINFGRQMLIGDSADNLKGLPTLGEDFRKKYSIRKTSGVGAKTAEAVLSHPKSENDVRSIVLEAWESSGIEDWKDRLNDLSFFLYLKKSIDDEWDFDRHFGGYDYGLCK